MDNIQDSQYGKMCQALCRQTEARTSGRCSKHYAEHQSRGYMYLDLKKADGKQPVRSWETVTVLPGASSTHNILVFHSVGGESTLWQILQEDVPAKYFLSAKACRGILIRAERRRKQLPPMLREALEESANILT